VDSVEGAVVPVPVPVLVPPVDLVVAGLAAVALEEGGSASSITE